MLSDSGLRVIFFPSLFFDVHAAWRSAAATMRRVGVASRAGGPTPPRIPTCPCLRRRPESEVLVGCSAASVSEASLAFCCVERLKTNKTNKEKSQRDKSFPPQPPTRGSGMNEVDFKPHPARVSGLTREDFSDYDRANRRPFEGKRGGTYG